MKQLNEVEMEEWFSSDYHTCEICRAPPSADGDELICDGCQRAYHPKCISRASQHTVQYAEGMPHDTPDSDDLWYCKDCRPHIPTINGNITNDQKLEREATLKKQPHYHATNIQREMGRQLGA